jgi:hypothetical protein
MGAKTKKQPELVGFERTDIIPDIEELAAPYTTALYQRQELQDEENKLREQLGARMDALGVERYVYRDGEAQYVITRDAVMKVKVKRVKDPDGGDAPAAN